ncbi:helicase-associated domain-containing protein [Paenibacillus guangzhouensis]|uniref:helicase-associated domain-containing protein n=1 Tax=Paenibacillus guangzhouensis TaxID=1473112 RepID=UPI001266B244|nr:helicase-associated domain-containing protein [Paenibacillus guangzhouensis]
MNTQEIASKLSESDLHTYQPALEAARSHAALSFLLEQLPQIALETLDVILKQVGTQSFELPQLTKLAGTTVSGASLRVGVHELRRHGLIYAVRKAWGDQLFFIPTDLYAPLQHLRLPLELQPVHVNPSDLTMTHEAGRGLAYELFYMLATIAKNGAPLTAKGTLHKNHIQKMLTSLQITVRDLVPLQLQYPHPDTLPSSIALVLDCGFRFGLLRKTPEAYELEHDKLFLWLSQPQITMQQRLWQLWLTVQPFPERWIQQCMVAMACASYELDAWYTVSSFSGWIERHRIDAKKYSSRQEIEDLIQDWLAVLCAFGWAELSTAHDGERLFRYTLPSGLERIPYADYELQDEYKPLMDGKFYVQPDLEIIVPPDVSFLTRWELECCADLIRSDQVAVYRLTKDSYMRAVDQGRSVQDLIDFLGQKSLSGLPESVRATLEHWRQQYGRVYLSEVVLLRCEDAEMAQRIQGMAQLLPQIIPIGAFDFIVPSDQVDALRSTLDKAGITPRRQIESSANTESMTKIGFARFNRVTSDVMGSGEGEDESLQLLNQGYIYTQQNVQYYDLDTSLPSREELFPEIARISPMWLQQLRAYHTSTMKEIIERAMAWQTYIRLGNKTESIVILPHQVWLNGGAWHLKGFIAGQADRGVQEVSSDTWDQIQLILPTIN